MSPFRTMRRAAGDLKAALVAGLLALAAAVPARAHEIRPAIAEIAFDKAGGYVVTVSLNLEALVAGIGPEHDDTAEAPNAADYDRLRALPPAALRAAFDGFEARFLKGVHLVAGETLLRPAVREVRIPPVGDTALARISEIELAGPLPAGAESLTWAWDAGFGASVIRARGAAGPDAPITYAAYLQGGQPSAPIPVAGGLRQSWWEVAAEYLVIGFTHILPKGLDHILFVVGLVLLSTRLAPLVWQVTAFTVAHTVTLALGMLGWVAVSPRIVEPLIAASIVYVCVENLLTDRLQRWRPAVVFGFGLLHGLGFAGVLGEVGLQPGHFVAGLVAFNVGVELGQLTIVAACLLGFGLWLRDKPYYRRAVTMPASAAIALVGAAWFVERTFGA